MNIHKHAVTYALATGIVVIAFSLSIYLAGVMNSMWNYVSYLVYTILLVIAIKNFRDKERNGILSYGKTFGYSTLFSLYYCLLMAVWTYVFMSYIAPGFMESEMMKQEALMEAKGMPQEQVELAMTWARKFSNPPVVACMALFGGMIMNSILNLIISAFTKKDADQNFDSTNSPIA